MTHMTVKWIEGEFHSFANNRQVAPEIERNRKRHLERFSLAFGSFHWLKQKQGPFS